MADTLPMRCSPLLLVALFACARAAPGVESRFAAGKSPGSLAIADFDRDGKLDLAIANEQSADVTVLLGDGRGGFAPARGSPYAAGANPNDVTVADFDRDGSLDLALADHETQFLTVLLGDGHGAFAPSPRSPVRVAVRPHVHGLAAGDFNGDGFPDLVTDSWAENRLQVLYGDGKGGFAAASAYVAVGKHPYQRVRVADLDADGVADIVSPNLDGGDVTVLLGDGKGGFREPKGSPFACNGSPFNVAIGDLDADGDPDLAIVNSPGSTPGGAGIDGLTILRNDGHGVFARVPGAPFATGDRPNRVAIGDLDGDGVAEVAVSRPDADVVAIFHLSRDHSVKSRVDLAIAGHPKDVAIRDLDGDGRADLLVTNQAAGAVTVVLGKPR